MKALYLVMAACILLLFAACSSKDSGGSGTGLPNLGDENYVTNYQSIISLGIDSSPNRYLEASCSVWVKNTRDSLHTPVLKINDITLDYYDNEFDEENDGYWYWYYFSPNVVHTDTANSYELTLGSNVKQGNITLPTMYEITYPDYTPNTDYVLNWSLENNPDIQWFSYDISLPAEQYDWINVQISPSIRTYTIAGTKLAEALYFSTYLEADKINENTPAILTLGATSTQKGTALTNLTKIGIAPDFKKLRKELLRRTIMNLKYQNK
jgi:hypothetical protein